MLHQKTILPGADHFRNMYYVDFLMSTYQF